MVGNHQIRAASAGRVAGSGSGEIQSITSRSSSMGSERSGPLKYVGAGDWLEPALQTLPKPHSMKKNQKKSRKKLRTSDRKSDRKSIGHPGRDHARSLLVEAFKGTIMADRPRTGERSHLRGVCGAFCYFGCVILFNGSISDRKFHPSD